MADQDPIPRHATVREFWPHAATCWFTTIDAQLSRQGLRVAILAQLLTEDIALEVSDVTLNDYLKEAILRRTQPAKCRARNTLLGDFG